MDVCAAPALLLPPLLLPLHHHPESRQEVGSTSAIVCLANGWKRSQPKGFKKKKHREIIKGIDAGAAVHAGIKAELFSKATDSVEEKGKRPKSKNATAHVPGKHV